METRQRSLNTLYKLLWEQIKDRRNLDEGLCNECFWIIQNKKELEMIKEHIQSNMPQLKLGTYTSIFGWTAGSTNERKEFVQRMVKETEND